MAKSSRPSKLKPEQIGEASPVCLIVVKERGHKLPFFSRADWIDAEEPDRLSANKVIQSKSAKRSTNV
jgi:hypothetical protein